jgi:formylglycine-generating enzyme required for sulfatase activity/serine/threonine protein kinase
MTAQSLTCPPESVLSDFGLGKLDGASAETVSQHMETCADCRQRVAGLSGDSFVGRLRQAGGAAQPAAQRQRTYVPGESLANAASSTDGSSGLHVGQPPSVVSREQDGPGSASSLTSPPELANHPDYELIKELGQGGMGTVYLANNRMMDRLEVLKVISKSLLDRPGALERFQQEIRSAAKLSHPNIVAAHSVLRPGELLVFAMEYVRGQDLAAVVKQRGPLPAANAAFYIHQVANGLQHAFEKGMVHRDIKPNNLMLAIEGKKHVVKVLDFGLAKATSEKNAETGLTKSGQMLGTPDYVAPEQTLDAHKADIRADIYSLGCTLYFLLSGGPPFQETSLFEILKAHHERDPKPLNLVRPDLPVELAAVVAKMMAKDPTNRYQTPMEVARALVPFFKPGQSVATAPPGDIPQAPPAAETEYGLAASTVTSRATPATPPLAPAPPTAATVESRVAKATPVATERSQPSAKPWFRSNLPVAIGIAFALPTIAIVLWAAVFRVSTADGILVVEVNEPNPDVYVDGEKITVTWQNGGVKAEVEAKPGTRNVELKKDGFRVYGQEVTLEDHGRTLLVARLEPILPKTPPQVPPAVDAPQRETAEKREPAGGKGASPAAVAGASTPPGESMPAGGRQVKPRELSPKTPAEVDRGQSVLASTDSAEIAEIVGEVAPGFTAQLPVIPGGVAIVAEHFGRTCVLSTHPLDSVRPCILTSTIDVPTDKKTSLTFDVSHSRAGDWQVIVLANGEHLYDSTVGPTTAQNGWLAVSVDLTRFASKQVVVELQNKATGYSHEWGFWDNVKITSREVEESQEASPTDAVTAPSTEEESLVSSEEGSRAGEERDDNALKLKLCWCPPGRFRMGSPTNEPERGKNEGPVNVTLSRGFWLGQFEVTQSQWQSVMGTTVKEQRVDQRNGAGPDHPIYHVSHTEAEEFCRKFTESERGARRLPSGWEYRLPTEAQWEYACRAGTTTATAFGNRLGSVDANFAGGAPYNGAAAGPFLDKTAPVGKYRPNAWGLYDMHGNVWEWCRDGTGGLSFFDDVEPLRGGVDPLGPAAAQGRVMRGGSWRIPGRDLRSAFRLPRPRDFRYCDLGFRVARVPSEEPRGTSSKALKRMVDPEIAGSETPSAGAPTSTTLKVVVPAKRTMGLSQAALLDRTTDTGLRVTEGQRIRLVVTGTVSLENQVTGKSRPQKSRKRKLSPKPGDDVIVCAIGQPEKPADQRVEGRPAMDFVAQSSGHLFIGIADDSRVDNEGSLTVEIRVE